LYERFFDDICESVDGEVGLLAFEDHAEVGMVAEIGAKYRIEIPPPSGRPGPR